MTHYHWLVGAVLLTAASWGGGPRVIAGEEDTFSAAYHLAKVDFYENAIALADRYIALYEKMKADYQALYVNTGRTPGPRVPKDLVQRFDSIIAYARKMKAFYEKEADWHLSYAEQLDDKAVANRFNYRHGGKILPPGTRLAPPNGIPRPKPPVVIHKVIPTPPGRHSR